MPLAPGRPVRSGIRWAAGWAADWQPAWSVLRRPGECPRTPPARAPGHAAIAEQEVPELEEPHAAPHLRVPAHGTAQPPVRLEKRPPDRLGAELYEGFDRLHHRSTRQGGRWRVERTWCL